jgi:hypothetical protein
MEMDRKQKFLIKLVIYSLIFTLLYAYFNGDKAGYLLAGNVFSIILYLALVLVSDLIFEFLVAALPVAYSWFKLLIFDWEFIMLASKSVPAFTAAVVIIVLAILAAIAYLIVSGMVAGVETPLVNNLGLDYVFLGAMFVIFFIVDKALKLVIKEKVGSPRESRKVGI